MQLLKMLQEASSAPISDLKKIIQKDPRVSAVLKKGLKLEDIPNIPIFLSTIKYHLLNNQNVKQFVDARSYIKDLDSYSLKDLRKIQAGNFTQHNLDVLVQTVADVFKEHTSVGKGTLTTATKKELTAWVNNNSKSANLSRFVINDLMSIPNIRPDRKIVVYRGLLFKSNQLTSREEYDGTLEKGNGVKFLQSLRKGGKEVDLEWDKTSSWTTSKHIAQNFAKYGPASSHNEAMLKWFNNAGKFIEGDLGYVISTLVDPKDVIVDLNMVNGVKSNHGNEAEIILQPGNYLCRVVNKYTVTGEVDTTDSGEDLSVTKIFEKIKGLEQVIKIPKVDGLGKYNSLHLGVNVIQDKKIFSALASNSMTTEVNQLIDEVNKYYEDNLVDIDISELRTDKIGINDDILLARDAVKKIIKDFSSPIRHKKFKDAPSGRGRKTQLSVDEYRDQIYVNEINSLMDIVNSGDRLNYANSYAIESMIRSLGLDLAATMKSIGATNLQRVGQAKIKQILDIISNAFYDKMGLNKPSENATVKMFSLMKAAYINARIILRMSEIKESLSKI